MILFSRTARLSSAGGLEWAASICEHISKTNGQQVQLWAHAYSPGYGTVGWSSWFAGLPELEAFGDEILADADYQAILADGADHVLPGSADDNVYSPIHGEPNADRDLTYVTAVQAVLANGSAQKGMAKGVEIAQRASGISGLPTMFASGMTGPYGLVGWLTGYESAAELQEANEKMGADPGFVELVDSSKGCYVEGSGVTTVMRRVV